MSELQNLKNNNEILIMGVTNYQKMLIENNKPKSRKKLLKPVVIPFSNFKEKSRDLDLSKAHVSMDGNTEKVTVKFLE